MTQQATQIAAYSQHAEPLIPAPYAHRHPSPAYTTETGTASGCPAWCDGGHGTRSAHTGPAAHWFGVITRLRMHRGEEAAVSILLDSPRNAPVTLDAEELRRVIDHLTTCRERLLRSATAA